MGFNFTGNLENVRQRQLDFIGEVLEQRGFNGPDAKIENVGHVGDNYIANVKRITVTENGKTFRMIAKLAPETELLRQMAQIGMLFRNETIIYTELFPKFVEIQKTAGVADLFRFAECYGTLNEAPNEVILLEDLKESHFQLLDRFKPLSNDSVKLVMKNMAIYNSLSYVLKHQEPETFDSIKSKFGDMYSGAMAQTEEGRQYFNQLEATALEIMTDDKYKKHLKGTTSQFYELNAKITEENKVSKYTVIHQGDSWTNNIMFRIKDDVPVECILIDYQMVKESNPAYDLMYMLFNCTTYEQRQKHYVEYLDHYHKELDESLQNYGLKANLLFPREQLDSDLKRYGKLMLAANIMIANTILQKTKDAEKMKKMMNSSSMENMKEMLQDFFNNIDPETRLLYKERVEGIVDSFIEFGYL